MVKYKVEVDLKTCVSTGACYATDRLHYNSGKNQQSNVIGGQTDESKSSNVLTITKSLMPKKQPKIAPYQP
jgi:ferredoxin